MSCRRVGLIGLRHNEVWNAIGNCNLSALAWVNHHRELVVQEALDSDNTQELVADLEIRGYGNHRLRRYLILR